MTTNASQARYRTRKGTTAIHVLDVCNQNLKFIYCLVGWEGSTHDSRVLRGSSTCYWNIHTNAQDFLAPYRGQCYHLQEWENNHPRSAEELFNMCHSSARNVIERAFGILEMRFVLLRDTSWYSQSMVELFFTACALLHNYIREEGGDDIFERAYLHTNDDPSLVVETVDEAPSYVESSEEWTRFRHTLAQHMWATRGV
ncbi:hypothetical protein LINPERHAP1_LOCUS158 [Linum perenne]